ncbi:nuclear transport factor 2 family protein [Acidaminobacter sp. JC074]|uniref:YybH family protein n=1 Tax=Acidaminobacter sp. JC074 TaxID=2530199 RepID=UPI001F0DDB74|nr:nuclear transport factor 2 family protein [Acidaminobacter sp. JC074]MCH4888627.1 nuclear transport factor 2 family protein [Acidaminobacter sp. JC074]
MENIRKAVDKGNGIWIQAFKDQDYEKLASYFHTDGAILGADGKVIEGRQAVKEYLQEFMTRIGPSTFTIETIDLYLVSGEIYEKGAYTLTIENGNRYEGKYIVEWKVEDGDYKFYRDIGI